MEPNKIVNASCNFDDGRMEEKGSLDHMIGVHNARVGFRYVGCRKRLSSYVGDLFV